MNNSVVIQEQLASAGSRLLAAIIDFLIIFFPTIIYQIINYINLYNTLEVKEPSDIFYGLYGLYILLIGILQIVLLTIHGQTLGKKVFKIKIVDITGEKSGFVQNILLRGLLNSIISIIPVYFLVDCLFIFSKNRRCVHDMIAKTKVIKISN